VRWVGVPEFEAWLPWEKAVFLGKLCNLSRLFTDGTQVKGATRTAEMALIGSSQGRVGAEGELGKYLLPLLIFSVICSQPQ
jgi:hypothetical protein